MSRPDCPGEPERPDGSGEPERFGIDRLEPYTCLAVFVAEADVADPGQMVASLLEDVARRCEDAGASLIGHIKCHARMGKSHFHCNLTSTRLGARCGAPAAEGPVVPGSLVQGAALELDLAVLVYGLPSSVLETVVSEALAGAGTADEAPTSPGRWALQPSVCAGSSEPGAGHRTP
jgi:hypothetical protein